MRCKHTAVAEESVDEAGRVLAGELSAKAARFVENNLAKIAERIRTIYYKK